MGSNGAMREKGKVVDVLTRAMMSLHVFRGGPNAATPFEFEGKKYVLRSIPSGIFQHGQLNIIGNGVVLDPCCSVKRPRLLKPAEFP